MKLKVNDKVTWKDKYGRLLPGIVKSLTKYDDVPELELNGCIVLSSPSFLPFSKEWGNVIIDPIQIVSVQ